MRLRVTAILAALTPFWLGGCGNHTAIANHSAVAIGRPDGPIWCPTSSGPVDAKQDKPNAPRGRGFDTRHLLGLAEDEAAATARSHGCLVRVIERDGRGFALTADFRANRVNVVIARGIVTSVGVY